MHIYNIQDFSIKMTFLGRNFRFPTEILSLVLLSLLVSFSASGSIELEIEKEIDQKIASMSLEEKVGQLFIFGFSGKSLTKRTEMKIQRLYPGALISFRRNLGKPYQILKLNRGLQKASIQHSKIPLLLMVDQEGGTVTRIVSRPKPPSALSIGLTKDPKLARSVGQVTGNILRFLGFNQNLAPVADLSDPEKRNFIGSRSFGNDPGLVRKMVQSVSHGHIQSLVLPTAKHFPGHGGILQDSHKELPRKLDTLEQLRAKELIPFFPLSRNPNFMAMMVAHLSLPKIDPSGLPATFSKKIVTGLLRKQLKYKGLVITDDIEMNGALTTSSVGQRALQAIQAGNDMVMVAWSYRRQLTAYETVLAAARSGELTTKRIHESLKRILYVKKQLNIEQQLKNQILDQKKFNRHYSKLIKQQIKLTHRISRLNAQKSFQIHNELKSSLEAENRIYLFSSNYSLFYSLKSSLPNPIELTKLRPGIKSPFQKLSSKKNPVVIYYVSGVGTAKILSKAPKHLRQNIIVLNSTYPGLIKRAEEYKAVFSVNTPNHRFGGWVGDFLSKEKKSKRLPASPKRTELEKDSRLIIKKSPIKKRKRPPKQKASSITTSETKFNRL